MSEMSEMSEIIDEDTRITIRTYKIQNMLHLNIYDLLAHFEHLDIHDDYNEIIGWLKEIIRNDQA